MVTARAAVTAAVVIVNDADVWPEGMLTLYGTGAAASLDFRVMVAPMIGAPSAMVTVPLTVFPLPPTTELLAKASCKAGIAVN